MASFLPLNAFSELRPDLYVALRPANVPERSMEPAIGGDAVRIPQGNGTALYLGDDSATPIRCRCGGMVARKATAVKRDIEAGLPLGPSMDRVGLKRSCCRMTIMTSPAIVGHGSQRRRNVSDLLP